MTLAYIFLFLASSLNLNEIERDLLLFHAIVASLPHLKPCKYSLLDDSGLSRRLLIQEQVERYYWGVTKWRLLRKSRDGDHGYLEQRSNRFRKLVSHLKLLHTHIFIFIHYWLCFIGASKSITSLRSSWGSKEEHYLLRLGLQLWTNLIIHPNRPHSNS